MNQKQTLLSIGTFASLARLSIKALRLYDQLDLLQPRFVDQFSGYRYYEADQLPRARMIRSMRDMDMPLATIRQVLAAINSSPAQAETLVRDYASMRERQMEQIKAQVQSFLQIFTQETNPMSIEVNVKKIAPQQVISVVHRVKVDALDATIRETVAMLNALLAEQNIRPTGAPFGIYHGAINEQEDGPIEICLPVKANVQGTGTVKQKQLKGGQAACAMLAGAQCAFPAVLGGYDATAEWIQKSGYRIADSPREVWHSAPGNDDKIEVIWLFK